VLVVYPRAEGVYPLIVCSHGAGGSGDVYRPLMEHWASYGYICAAPDHADARTLKGLADARAVVRNALTNREAWVQRPRDVKLVIDHIDKLQAAIAMPGARIDAKRIGVGGHSFGAYTAMATGGARVTIDPATGPQDLSDPRVRAVLAMSPQGPGQMGLTESSWNSFGLPLMCLTGTLDRGALGQDYAWRRHAIDSSPPGGKYFVVLEGADHFSFVGRGLPGAGRREIFGRVEQVTAAYWDAHLKSDDRAAAWLKQLAAEQAERPAIAVEVR
jgi:predicted dienelactone hydrolase